MDMTEEMMAGAQRLKQLGRCASALSGDDEIEKSTAKTAQKIEEDASFFLATTEQIQRMSADIAARRKLEESASDGSLTNEQADALIIQLDEAKGQLANAKDDALRTLVDEERRVRKILAEHDYIQRLLAGAGSATDKQFSVMAFPRGANTKTNVLQISGGAGTGKTLCLLAKLIQDTRPSRQMGLLVNQGHLQRGFHLNTEHCGAQSVKYGGSQDHAGKLQGAAAREELDKQSAHNHHGDISQNIAAGRTGQHTEAALKAAEYWHTHHPNHNINQSGQGGPLPAQNVRGEVEEKGA